VEVVQRVIGVGGDTVFCCDTHDRITVNGRPVTEDYVHPDPDIPSAGTEHLLFRTTVPSGTVFVAGDDRGNSYDSRFRGPVSIPDLRGVAVTDGSVPAFRRVPATTAFVAAGLPGSAGQDVGYLLDGALFLAGVLLLVVGGIWLLVIGVRAVLRRRRLSGAAV
jgi:signal peptidase I